MRTTTNSTPILVVFAAMASFLSDGAAQQDPLPAPPRRQPPEVEVLVVQPGGRPASDIDVIWCVERKGCLRDRSITRTDRNGRAVIALRGARRRSRTKDRHYLEIRAYAGRTSSQPINLNALPAAPVRMVAPPLGHVCIWFREANGSARARSVTMVDGRRALQDHRYRRLVGGSWPRTALVNSDHVVFRQVALDTPYDISIRKRRGPLDRGFPRFRR